MFFLKKKQLLLLYQQPSEFLYLSLGTYCRNSTLFLSLISCLLEQTCRSFLSPLPLSLFINSRHILNLHGLRGS
jgi:hypothetical protein